MRFGVFASILLHLAIVGAAFITPQFRKFPDVTPEPYIPLELIREAELDLKTSVPAAAPEPVEEEVEEPEPPEPEVEEEPPAPVEEPPAQEQEPEPEPEPEPVIEEPEPEPEEPEVKPEPKPEPPKETPNVKPEPQEQKPDLMAELENALKDLDPEKRDRQTSQTPSQTTETADQARQRVGAGDRLTASDEAKMRAAVERCWNASAIIGAPEPEKLVVTIEFELNRDGTLASPPRVANALQINLSGNRFWKVAEQSAVRAVVSCAPYDFLPQERYETWKEFTLNFDPSQMVGR